jgi:hypothetical protein
MEYWNNGSIAFPRRLDLYGRNDQYAAGQNNTPTLQHSNTPLRFLPKAEL